MPAKKQITKEMILSAALDILRESGAESLTVTALASKLNCSTQPIYLSFSGMDELRSAATVEAFKFFNNYAQPDGEKLTAISFGAQYIRFAAEERELFKFLFMRRTEPTQKFAEEREYMENAIQSLMEKYHIDHNAALTFFLQLWACVHGIATMLATEFRNWNIDFAMWMLEDIETSLGAKFTNDRE